jgi:CRP/FNR family transcriptional regulator, cyclic AMP receptor protein
LNNQGNKLLKNIVDKMKRAAAPSPEMMTHDERNRAVEGSNSAERAATLLIAPTALMQLTLEDAKIVVSYMSPRKIARGTTFIKEGDKTDTAYMVLLLEGEVTVESITVSRSEPVTVTVLGPGSLIGEMGLVDGEARLASCTATTNVRCANLTRAALEKLTADDPATAAKLILAVALRIAVRLRDTAEKLKLYSQLVLAMQQEIDHMMPTPIELIGRSIPPR